MDPQSDDSSELYWELVKKHEREIEENRREGIVVQFMVEHELPKDVHSFVRKVIQPLKRRLRDEVKLATDQGKTSIIRKPK